MVRHFLYCGIAALLFCIAFATSVPDAEDLSTVDRQGGRPCGSCPRVCYRMRSNAVRDCMGRCRGNANCAVRRCTRDNDSRGFRCRGPRRMRPAPPPPGPPPAMPPLSVVTVPPPVVTVAPPVVVAPPIVVAPTMTATASPSSAATPSVSPSVTPSPSASPTPSATSSVTPTPSVTPSTSPSCSFAITGAIGATATNGVCTCGTDTASVTVLAPVDNGGGALDMTPGTTDAEAFNCYNGCVGDLFNLACDPGSMATFAADGAAIVSSCCDRCRNMQAGSIGTGVNAATNQCRLAV